MPLRGRKTFQESLAYRKGRCAVATGERLEGSNLFLGLQHFLAEWNAALVQQIARLVAIFRAVACDIQDDRKMLLSATRFIGQVFARRNGIGSFLCLAPKNSPPPPPPPPPPPAGGGGGGGGGETIMIHYTAWIVP